MISEAQRFWDAIVGKVRKVAQEESKNAFRCERYEVTTAPNGSKIGVTLPLGSKEIFLPYSSEVEEATVGSQVLVVWWGSMSNAKVYYNANGFAGVSGTSSPLASWPIGSIFTSTSSINPGSIIGGSWRAIGEGVVLMSAGANYTAGTTVGAETVTLTEDNIPSHTHGSKSLTGTVGVRRYGSSAAGNNTVGVKTKTGILSTSTDSWSGEHGQLGFAGNYNNTTIDTLSVDASHEHSSFGKASPDAISTIQPSLVVYMWERIA